MCVKTVRLASLPGLISFSEAVVSWPWQVCSMHIWKSFCCMNVYELIHESLWTFGLTRWSTTSSLNNTVYLMSAVKMLTLLAVAWLFTFLDWHEDEAQLSFFSSDRAVNSGHLDTLPQFATFTCHLSEMNSAMKSLTVVLQGQGL